MVERYRFLKNEQVSFDIEGFTRYLQTLQGGNKDYEPAKAIAAHVRDFFRFTPSTKPPYMALLDFHSLEKYFGHLKSIKFSVTTIADKLRALRQAIEYVMYEHSDEGSFQTYTKCQVVHNQLKNWGRALTKDIRKQRNQSSVKSSCEV